MHMCTNIMNITSSLYTVSPSGRLTLFDGFSREFPCSDSLGFSPRLTNMDMLVVRVAAYYHMELVMF